MLAPIFNILLLRSFVPTPWITNMTVLIHKAGNRLNLSNVRPITISSAVLFHRILSKRISSLQRSFIETNGTLPNNLMLDTYIKSRCFSGKSYNVMSCDVRKAFDSVNHDSIRLAFFRFNVPEAVKRYILLSLLTAKPLPSSACMEASNKATLLAPFSLTLSLTNFLPS